MSDKKENRGGRRKGAGRPHSKDKKRKVAFDIEQTELTRIKGHAQQKKLTLAAIIRQAIKAYNFVDPWISVKDRLPENSGTFIIAFIATGGKPASGQAIWGDGSWWFEMGEYSPKAAKVKVTHWQPLPSPPEKT